MREILEYPDNLTIFGQSKLAHQSCWFFEESSHLKKRLYKYIYLNSRFQFFLISGTSLHEFKGYDSNTLDIEQFIKWLQLLSVRGPVDRSLFSWFLSSRELILESTCQIKSKSLRKGSEKRSAPGTKPLSNEELFLNILPVKATLSIISPFK